MSKYCKLNREFVEQLEVLGWPTQKELTSYLRDKLERRWSNQEYADVRKGLAASTDFVFGLVQYVQQHRDLGENKTARELLAGSATSVSVEDFELQHEDYLSKGFFEGTLKVFKAYRLFDVVKRSKGKCFCRNENQIRKAVDIYKEAFGRQTSGDDRSLTESQAIAKANGVLDHESLYEYTIKWWRRNPFTTMLNYSNGVVVGATTVLPVTEHGYLQMRQGKKDCFHVDPDWVVERSPYVLIQGQGATKRAFKNPRRSFGDIVLATMYHFALLGELNSRQRPPRFLSFIASELNRKKLLKHGFEPLGISMPNTGWEMAELRFDSAPNMISDIRKKCLLSLLQSLQGNLKLKSVLREVVF